MENSQSQAQPNAQAAQPNVQAAQPNVQAARKDAQAAEILNLIGSDPSAGLGEVLKVYGSALKTICGNILGHDSPEEVEECISDILLELWKGRDRIDLGQGSLKSYLYGIARHKAIDRRRKIEARPKNVISINQTASGLDGNDDGAQDGGNAMMTALPDELVLEADFTEEVARHDNASIVQAAVDGLEEPEREIFIRRYFFFEKVSDIAMHLDLPEKTIENKLYRGKAGLKKILLERGIIL